MPSRIYKRSIKYRKNMSKIMKGRHFTKQWRKNISKSLMGHIVTPETIKKMSKSLKGKLAGSKHFNWTNTNVKCLVCKKIFHRKPSHAKRNGKKFCSQKCKNIYQSQSYMGKKHPNWKGGITINSQGYVFIYKPKHPFRDCHNYVRKHRLIMEKTIGRYLKPFEQIHHINGNKQDNRIENLMYFPNNSAHIKFHQEYKTS